MNLEDSLLEKKRTLVLRVREILARKKELIENGIKDELEKIAADVRVEHLALEKIVDVKLAKILDALDVLDNVSAQGNFNANNLLRIINGLTNILRENHEPVIKHMAMSSIIRQYNLFAEKGEIGDFSERGKTKIEYMTNLLRKNDVDKDFLVRIYNENYLRIKHVDDLLKQRKADEDEFRALSIECKEVLKELSIVHKTISGFLDEYSRKYGNSKIFDIAKAQASTLVDVLEANRCKKLAETTTLLNDLKSRYESVNSYLQSSFNGDYPNICEAYAALKVISKTDNYKINLSVKNKILTDCRNSDAEKEVELFRKAVRDAGYAILRAAAPTVLSAVNRLDESTLIGFQKKEELAAGISEAMKNQDIFSLSLYKKA